MAGLSNFSLFYTRYGLRKYMTRVRVLAVFTFFMVLLLCIFSIFDLAFFEIEISLVMIAVVFAFSFVTVLSSFKGENEMADLRVAYCWQGRVLNEVIALPLRSEFSQEHRYLNLTNIKPEAKEAYVNLNKALVAYTKEYEKQSSYYPELSDVDDDVEETFMYYFQGLFVAGDLYHQQTGSLKKDVDTFCQFVSEVCRQREYLSKLDQDVLDASESFKIAQFVGFSADEC